MENTLTFSSRARLVCLKSDPAQPHFLNQKDIYLASRIRGYQPSTSNCIICNGKNIYNGYHLYCETCDSYIHYLCFFKPLCRLSDLTNPHTLEAKFGRLGNCFSCGGSDYDGYFISYECPTCKLDFHGGCHLYPPVIKHPFHSLHPLTLTFSSHSLNFIPSKHLPTSLQYEEPFDSETELETAEDASISDAKCKCCQKKLQHEYYHCSICNFSINLACTRNPPLVTITNFKSHEHILTFFARLINSPCDACGLSLENTHDLVYACVPCNYIVHMTCIYLPRVIKITRHSHRLSLSASLPPGLFPCGVCRHTINVSYGQFSCQKGCHYAVHSRCAVEGYIWDGKDLEGVHEEEEEDTNSFLRIDEETIQHFSHGHHLKLHVDNSVWGENKFCEACTLPILVSESSYCCMVCSYNLHESCAFLPFKMDHPLHKHSLFLFRIPLKEYKYVTMRMEYGEIEPCSQSLKRIFKCNGCDQVCGGFVYRCEGCNFHLDVRCVSLPDPFLHGSHPHDLFFNLTKGECMGCKSSDCSPFSLECMECKSFLGLKCATLPVVTRYKHDKHPLILCYGEEKTSSGQYWCEICEAKLDSRKWFYACDDCNVTLHVSCLLGEMFLKPTSYTLYGSRISFIRNSRNTRAICQECRRRCAGPIYFHYRNLYFCSLNCLYW